MERSKSGLDLVSVDYDNTENITPIDSGSIEYMNSCTKELQIRWKAKPKSVLIVSRPDESSTENLHVIAKYLQTEHSCEVFVEEELADMVKGLKGFTWTILHMNTMFPASVPPLVAFSAGSLGFLTSHDLNTYDSILPRVMKGNISCTLRMRLCVRIVRKGENPEQEIHVLNEVVMDRGTSPYLLNVICESNGYEFTTVQADGVIVATPTGSTAYSLAAGGSMVHPSVPGMLLTPICPHSLSFRPIILPDSMKLRLKVPETARSAAWVSFDGRGRQEIAKGDAVEIYASKYPVPVIQDDGHHAWLRQLSQRLHWNVREEQKPLAPRM